MNQGYKAELFLWQLGFLHVLPDWTSFAYPIPIGFNYVLIKHIIKTCSVEEIMFLLPGCKSASTDLN